MAMRNAAIRVAWFGVWGRWSRALFSEPLYLAETRTGITSRPQGRIARLCSAVLVVGTGSDHWRPRLRGVITWRHYFLLAALRATVALDWNSRRQFSPFATASHA